MPTTRKRPSPSRSARSAPTHTRPDYIPPVFHTGQLQSANNCSRKLTHAFKTRLVDNLVRVRDAQGSPRSYTFTPKPADVDSHTTAEWEYAYQAGCKLGLKVTPHIPRNQHTPSTAHPILFERHIESNRGRHIRSGPHPGPCQVLIQLVHTPKCAGRFLKQQLLRKMAGPPSPDRKGLFPRSYHIYSKTHRCTYVFVNGHVPARNFSPYAITVGLVRDPYTRFVSAFQYLRNGGYTIDPQTGQQTVHYDWDTKWREQLRTYPTLLAFLKDNAAMTRALSINRGKEHFFPLTYWLCDGSAKATPLIDFAIRQEHFADDIKWLFATLGVDAPPAEKKSGARRRARAAQVNVTVTAGSAGSTGRRILTPAETRLFDGYYPKDRGVFERLSDPVLHAERWERGVGKLRGLSRAGVLSVSATYRPIPRSGPSPSCVSRMD